MKVPAGTALERTGVRTSVIYIIARGTVLVRLQGSKNRRARPPLLGPEAIVGLHAALEGLPSLANATTVTDCVMYALTASLLKLHAELGEWMDFLF